jgi:glycine C-acetyltransferase
MGGFTTARAEIVDMLRQRSRPYLFSNTLPPAIIGAATRVFDVLSADTSKLEQLRANTKQFRETMTRAGFEIKGQNHPISPVMLYDAKLATEFADEMLKKGIREREREIERGKSI